MKKYGISNFTAEELIQCDNEELDSYEIAYINKLNTYSEGYNATKGGDGKILFDYEQILECYKQGGTITETACKIKCSIDTVKKVLTIYNFPIRHVRCGCSEPKKIKQFSLEGEFIRDWDSITQAAHWLVDNGYAKTYNGGVKQKISLCVQGS